MTLKKSLLFLSCLLLLLFAPTVLAVSSADAWDAITGFITDYSSHKDAYNFILVLIIFIAAFTIGARKTASLLGWEDKVKNAVTALGIAIGFALTFAAHFFLKEKGIYLLDWLGGFSILALAALILLVFGLVFYKKDTGGNLTPFIVASVIVVLFYAIDAIFPNYLDQLGFWGNLIYLLFIIASIYIVLKLFFFFWNQFSFGALKAKKGLSDAEMSETEKAIKQKSALNELARERAAASEARRDERKSRKSIRRLDPDLEKAAEILGSLHQAVASMNPREISGKWKLRDGELKDLEKLKVRIGGYSGLIDKIVAEMIGLPSNKVKYAQKKQLDVFQKAILANFKTLEDNIATITKGLNKIHETGGTPQLWAKIADAIKNASKSLGNIHTNSLGTLALEQKIRDEIGRA